MIKKMLQLIDKLNNPLYPEIHVDQVYPVGAIYLSIDNKNPSELFGGTWVAFGGGRALVGVGTGNFAGVETLVGAETHTLALTQMPSHNHGPDADINLTASTTPGVGQAVGPGPTHNHTVNAHTHNLDNNGYPLVGNNGASGSFGWVPQILITGVTSAAYAGGGLVNAPSTGPNHISFVAPLRGRTAAMTAAPTVTNATGTHQHTGAAHQHALTARGGNQAHNNIQPSITVYMFKRIA